MAENIIDKIATPEESLDGTEQLYAVKDGTTDARFPVQKIVDKTLADVDKNDVALGNVDNTSDADKPISTAQATKNTSQDVAIALNTAKRSYPVEDETKLDGIEPGAEANVNADWNAVGGDAQILNKPTLFSGDYEDLSNKPDLTVFDNISEHADFASFPGTGEADKFYLAQDSGILYRWTGSGYSVISAELAIVETSNTAYRGDRGKIAYDHSLRSDNPHDVSKAQVGLGNVPNTDATLRANHTGTQLASTISDFATTVLATVLTGLSLATSTAVTATDTILVAIGKLQAQISLKADKYSSVNAQTGTSYTLVLADASKLVSMNNASANTLTVPPNADVAFPVGTRILVQQLGAGATTIATGSGVTINNPSTVPLAIDEQYESRGLLKTDTDTWQLI